MIRPRRALVATLLALALGAAVPARAVGPWENHVNASAITEIVADGGTLHMTTLGGLLLYDIAADRFTQFDNSDGLPSVLLTSLAIDPSGAIYAGTVDIGIVKVRVTTDGLQRLRSFSEQIDGLSDNRIRSVTWWKDRVVYGAEVGMGTILNDFAAARWFERDGLPADAVNDVLSVGDFVWVATDSGVAVLDEFGIVRSVAGSPGEANAIGADGGTIWVGTDTGVRRFDPADSSWSDLGLDNPPRRIHAFFYDGADMWASDRFIMYRYLGSGQSWAVARADSLVFRYELTGGSLVARGLYVDAGGVAYMGTGNPSNRRGMHLVRFDGSVMEPLIPNAPAAGDIPRLSIDADGSLWASFRNYYVGKLTPDGEWVNYNGSISASDSLSSRYSNLTCFADSRGIKWFCTLSTPGSPVPLDRLDDGLDTDYGNDSWTHLGIGAGGGDGLGSLRLQRATEDPAGNVWFLSDDQWAASGWWGIQILRADESAWFRNDPGTEPRMPSGNVADVAFDASEAYVAFPNYGVRVWSPGGFGWAALTNRLGHAWRDKVRLGDRIPGDATISALALASDGVLWLGTNRGLFRVSGTAIDSVVAYVGLTPGLLSPTVTDIVLDHEENVWVATPSGLNRVARNDLYDIGAYSTAAEYARTLAPLRYPPETITPLVDAQCYALAVHPTRDLLYVGTAGGLSVVDISPPAATATDLTRVYVYPNPVNNRLGHQDLKIANITSAVSVEIYNLEGELVHSQEAAADGEVIWDLTTASGYVVASGIYMVRIRSSADAVVRPVSVIR